MALSSKFKTLGTSLLATRSKWIRWPKRQLAAGELSQARVPLWSYTTDRKQIFSGSHSMPSVTGKGVLELWKNGSQHLAESESVIATERSTELSQARVPLWSFTTDRQQIFSGPFSIPSLTGKGVLEVWKNESQNLAEREFEIATESSTVFRVCKYVLVLGGVAGIYFIVRWNRNRKLQRNIAFQQAIVQGVIGAVEEGVKDPVVQAAKQAIKTAVAEAFQDAKVINEAIAKAFLEAQNVHAQALDVPPVPTQNLTTEMVIKAFLAAGNGQEIDLEAFLKSMGLVQYLDRLKTRDVFKVEDLARAPQEQLAGIPQNHIVKLKNAAFYLLDLHNPSFTLL